MPHLWDTNLNEPSLNKAFESEEIFHLSSKLCTLYSEVLHGQSNNKEIIKWLFVHGPPCLTHECNIGPGDCLGPILHSRVKYSGPFKKSHSITSKYIIQNVNLACCNSLNLDIVQIIVLKHTDCLFRIVLLTVITHEETRATFRASFYEFVLTSYCSLIRRPTVKNLLYDFLAIVTLASLFNKPP